MKATPDTQWELEGKLYDIFILEINEGEDVTGDVMIECSQHTWDPQELASFVIRERLQFLYSWWRESRRPDCTGRVLAHYYCREAQGNAL